jgi:hypothetical protein
MGEIYEESSVRIEFDYTPNDLKEALRWQAAQKRRKMRFGRGLFGWLLFVTIAALVFVWLRVPAPGSVPPPVSANSASANSDWDVFFAVFPWVIVAVAVLALILFRSARRHMMIWKKYVHIRQTQTFVFDDDGVRAETVFYESLYRWPFFVRWGESRNLLLLVLPGDLQLFIPKRALATEKDLEQLRQLFRAGVTEAAGGFPVGPPRQAVQVADVSENHAERGA